MMRLAVLVLALFASVYAQSGNSKITVDTSKQTDWRGALQQCTDQGKQLVSVQTSDKNMEILQAIGRTNIRKGHFWTAGTDQYLEGDWIWETTGSPFNYTYWHGFQPDNFFLAGGEHCMGYWEVGLGLLLRGYKWNDRPCDYYGYPICEDTTK